MIQDAEKVVKKFVKDYGWKGRVFAISAINGMGCKELTYAIMDHLDEVKKTALWIKVKIINHTLESTEDVT